MTTATEEHHDLYDPEGSKIGMWLFLFTEVILFGMLFLCFAVYLYQYRVEFMTTSAHLDRVLGSVNTLVLLTSSLTMALSIAALQRGKQGQSLMMMGVTLLFAVVFLCIKAMEWGAKFEHHLYPQSEVMLQKAPGEQIFYGLYFTMTGLHAAHILIGMTVIISAMILVKQGKVHQERLAFIENTGLYWHLVDVIWIFLFPLFYLIG